MKIKNFEKLTKNDLPKIPEDLFKLLNPISEQVQLLTKALQGKLNFSENLSGERKTLNIEHNTATKFKLSEIQNPIGVLLLWSELADYATLTWEKLSTEEVSVRVYFDSTPSTPIKVELLIIGD